MTTEVTVATTSLDAADVAAWVQAVGSIVAILAGFALIAFQHWQEKRSRAQTLLGLAASVIVQLNGLRITLDTISRADDHATVFQRASVDLRALRDVIFSVDLSAIGHEVVWSAFGGFVSSVDTLLATMDRTAEELAKGNPAEAVSPSVRRLVCDRMKFTAIQVRSISNSVHKYYGVRGTRREATIMLVQALELWEPKSPSTGSVKP